MTTPSDTRLKRAQNTSVKTLQALKDEDRRHRETRKRLVAEHVAVLHREVLRIVERKADAKVASVEVLLKPGYGYICSVTLVDGSLLAQDRLDRISDREDISHYLECLSDCTNLQGCKGHPRAVVTIQAPTVTSGGNCS